MIDTLTALLQAGALPQTTYGPQSRYAGLAPSTYIDASGRAIPYAPRRFIPAMYRYTTLQMHSVQQGERIDVIATRFLGDPLLYWRICDANLAVRPEDATIVGTVLRITLPPGVSLSRQ